MNFFSSDYWLLWALGLALALFFPVRRLIHVLLVRRAKAKVKDLEEAEIARLKRRASATSALLCLVFSVFYTFQLFSDAP